MEQAFSSGTALRIPVVVVPLCCGDEVVGWSRGALKIRVVAGSAHGRDNDAVESLLAEVIGTSRGKVRVIAGRGSQRKWVEIEDCDETVLEQQLPGR